MKAENQIIEAGISRISATDPGQFRPESSFSSEPELGLVVDIISGRSLPFVSDPLLPSLKICPVLGNFIGLVSRSLRPDERNQLWALGGRLAESKADLSTEQQRLLALSDWLVIEMLPIAVRTLGEGAFPVAIDLSNLRRISSNSRSTDPIPGSEASGLREVDDSRFNETLKALSVARALSSGSAGAKNMDAAGAVFFAELLVLANQRAGWAQLMNNPYRESSAAAEFANSSSGFTLRARKAGQCIDRIIAAVSAGVGDASQPQVNSNRGREIDEERELVISKTITALDRLLGPLS